MRESELDRRWVGRGDRTLVLIKDLTVGTVGVTGLATATAGVAFSFAGAVPVESGGDPAPETPSRAARIKRLVNRLGALNLGSELALVAVNAALIQRQRQRRLT